MSCTAMTQLMSPSVQYHVLFLLSKRLPLELNTSFYKIFSEKCKFALTYARKCVKYRSTNLFNRTQSYVQNLQYHVCHAA